MKSFFFLEDTHCKKNDKKFKEKLLFTFGNYSKFDGVDMTVGVYFESNYHNHQLQDFEYF